MSPVELRIDREGIAVLAFGPIPASFPVASEALRAALHDAIETLVARLAEVRGVILELGSASTSAPAGDAAPAVRPASTIYSEIEAIRNDLRRLETLGKPVVACLSAVTLDGAWEIALCAHRRIAPDAAVVAVGLTQVTRGLMPGAGGVVRSGRLLGFSAAAAQLIAGSTQSLDEAALAGLIDERADDPQALLRAAHEWIGAHAESRQPWDTKGFRIPGGGVSTPAVAQAVALAPAVLRKQTRGLYPAPEAILCALVESLQVDCDTALRVESRYLARLWTDPVTYNLLALDVQQRALAAGRLRPAGAAAPAVATVAVIGAGMMGCGIAYANAQRGIACRVRDVSSASAARALEHARHVSGEAIERQRMDERTRNALLGRLSILADDEGVGDVDLVIEAVFENSALKHTVLARSEAEAGAHTLLASNTSTLPISELATALRARERFVGLHFFSPVERMPLVEIIRGRDTSDDSLARAYDYVVQLGKTPIVVNDARGFFTSRTFGSFVLEGAAMLAEGVPAALIENSARLVGLPTGPLALLDETSLRLSLHVAEEAAAAHARSGTSPPPHPGEVVIRRMVETLGRAGRAEGGGFYDYPSGARKTLWGGLADAFARASNPPTAAAIGERFLYRQAIEAARCLDERVLRSVAEGNLGSILGIGFPRWTGGALQYIHHVGAQRFLAHAQRLADAHGARFALADSVIHRIVERDALELCR